MLVPSLYLKLDILVAKLCGGAPHVYVDSEQRRMPTLVEERIDSKVGMRRFSAYSPHVEERRMPTLVEERIDSLE